MINRVNNFKDFKKVLIVRPDALGDVILTFPMLVQLKKNYNNIDVYYLCSDYTQPLLKIHPLIKDTIIDITQKGKMKKNIPLLIKQLKKYAFDVVINCYHEMPFPKIMKKTLISTRIGEAFKFPSSLYFNYRISQGYREFTQHEVDLNLRLLLPLNITPSKIIEYGLNINTDYSSIEITEIMKRKQDYIVIHPGFGVGNGKIILSENKYRELIKHLVKKGETIVITGSQKELERNQKIAKGFKDVYNLTAKTSLTDLAKIIKNSKLMISVDTGPMHLATALNIPIVLLNITKYIKPTRWGTFGFCKIVTPVKHCHYTCFPSTCYNTFCVDNFSVNKIIDAIEQLLFSNNKTIDYKIIKSEMLKISLNILNLTNKKLGIENDYKVFTKNDIDRNFYRFIWNYDINVIVKKKIHWWDNLITRNLLAPKLYYPPLFITFEKLQKILCFE
jgi:ADP-heptose:LPS heptosyltransferase